MGNDVFNLFYDSDAWARAILAHLRDWWIQDQECKRSDRDIRRGSELELSFALVA